MGRGPQVLTPAYYRRLYTLEQGHGWFQGMRRLAGALLDPLVQRHMEWRILDAGCGTGSMLGWLDRFPGASVIGTDLSGDALAFCRLRGHRALVRGSVIDLPFRDQSFDLLVCADVLQHLPDPPGDVAALSEAYRVLPPGGYLYVRTNSRFGMGQRQCRADEPAGYHRYTRAELTERARAAGFRVERATYANSLPALLTLVRLVRRPHPQAASGGAGDMGLTLALRPPAWRWLDTALSFLLQVEAWYVRSARRSLPFGQTLLLLACKPGPAA